MTIQVWTLLFSAITSGLVLVGGIWLRYVVAQQLRSKDATIETLKAAIELHQAEITTLKGDRAPAIAAEYKVVKEYADKITQDKQKLDEQLRLLTEQRQERDKTRVYPPDPADIAIFEAKGLILGASILLKHLREPSGTVVEPDDPFAQGAFNAINEINREAQSRHDMVKGCIQDLREKATALTRRPNE